MCNFILRIGKPAMQAIGPSGLEAADYLLGQCRPVCRAPLDGWCLSFNFELRWAGTGHYIVSPIMVVEYDKVVSSGGRKVGSLSLSLNCCCHFGLMQGEIYDHPYDPIRVYILPSPPPKIIRGED